MSNADNFGIGIVFAGISDTSPHGYETARRRRLPPKPAVLDQPLFTETISSRHDGGVTAFSQTPPLGMSTVCIDFLVSHPISSTGDQERQVYISLDRAVLPASRHLVRRRSARFGAGGVGT